MHGMMMNRPLTIIELLKFASDVHGKGEIVSATVEGGLHRTTYRDTLPRAAKGAQALKRLGIGKGDRVATLAWNGYRHFELYYAISGLGAVCHTINPRLSADQMSYIVEHAGDKLLCLDLTFVPLIAALKDRLPADLRFIVMTDRGHMPEGEPLAGALCYEELLDAETGDFDWPDLDENAASSLCYTSGTTGNPKGALFSHRSTVLHALMAGVSFQDCLRPGKRILPVVPLFHVNAWGLPYAAPLTGASVIMPGPNLDGASLFDLMEAENVFSAWGVPTVWMGLMTEIRNRGRAPKGLGEMVVGGSAPSRSLIEAFEDHGVSVTHAWGMTEMSPIGTQGALHDAEKALPKTQQIDLKCAQGRRTYGVELKIVDEEGRALPHDGKATGELYVRGNTIISGYYNNPEATKAAFDSGGWFGTGDVARIDGNGFLTITDRAKDLIKSGGEWISSIDVENLAMSHPDVANCAVIAVPHPKWDERPLLVVVPASGAPQDGRAILDHLSKSLAKYQVPDDVVFADELPLTATGKVSKLTLRETYKDHVLPA